MAKPSKHASEGTALGEQSSVQNKIVLEKQRLLFNGCAIKAVFSWLCQIL
jgi:hypothetical protein